MMVNKKAADRMALELSTYLKYLHKQGNVGIRELWRRYPNYSLKTIHRHATDNIGSKLKVCSTPAKKRGRKRLLDTRDERMLLRSLRDNREKGLQVTSKRLQLESGLTHVSNRTVRRKLNENGYKFLQARKKGLMSRKDLKKRLKFAKDIINNRNNETFWMDELSFYLDGTTWIFKTNPCDQANNSNARVWRKPSEGLKFGCTAKGKKVGYGGKTVHFIVCISYSKGVIACEEYIKMCGKYFASLIKNDFQNIFQRSNNPDGNLFLQDGDPSQNSKAAKKQLRKLGLEIFPIPARSPDMNPIENFFHLIDLQLTEEAISLNITKETKEQFTNRVRNTIMKFPIEKIDSIIDTMPKRMHMVIENKGQRLKY